MEHFTAQGVMVPSADELGHQISHHHIPSLVDDPSAVHILGVDNKSREYHPHDLERREEIFVDPEWIDFLEKRHSSSCTKNCKKLNGEVVMSTRLSMLERTKEERDLMLLAFISMLTAQGAPTKRGKDRKHWTMKYQFQRTPICRETFLFAYGTTDKVLKSLMHHYKEHGLTPRVHGNKGKKVHHSLSEAKVTTVVNWINNFAHREGTAGQNARGRVKIVIPPNYTQRGLHRMYVENCQDQNVDYVGRSTFLALWRQRCDHIAVAKSKKAPDGSARPIVPLTPKKRKDDELLGQSSQKRKKTGLGQKYSTLYV